MSIVGEHSAVAAEIKRLRRDHIPPLSQVELARALDVSETFLNLVENGKRGISRKTAHKIARFFHLNPADERAFLLAAGIEARPSDEPLADLIQSIIVEDPDNPALNEFIRADLTLTMHGWRRLIRAQLDLRTGGADEEAEGAELLRYEDALSPLLRLHAKRQLADEARVANALQDARDWLLAAQESSELRSLDDATRYHSDLMRIELLTQMGDVALRGGDYRRAYDLYEECARGYRELPGAPLTETRGASTAAASRRGARSLPTNPSRPFATLTPDPEVARVIWSLGLGVIAQRIAEALMYLERTDEALDQCTAAEDYLRQTRATPRTERLLRRVTELRAWALARNQNYLKAAELQEQARAAAAQVHDTEAEMLNWLLIGEHYLHMVTVAIEDHAQRVFNKRKIALAPKAAWEEALLEESTPVTLEAWLERARAAFQQAYALQQKDAWRRSGFARGASHTLRGMATIARLSGKIRDATNLLQRAETEERKHASPQQLLFVFEERAELYWDKGFLSHAKREYQAALNAAGDDLVQIRDNQPKTRMPGQTVGDVLKAHRARLHRKLSRLDAAFLGKYGPPSQPEHSLDTVRDALKRLSELAIDLIRDGGWDPIAPDVDSEASLDRWLQEQELMEREPGARILCQREFSRSLARKLPPALQTLAGDRERLRHRFQHIRARRAEFRQSIHDADRHQLRGHSVLDICSKPWIEEYALDTDMQSRAREAARLMRNHPQGYSIVATPFELPFAFAVKGRYTLIEAPEAFLSAAGVHSAFTSPAGRYPSQSERRAGYRFDTETIAADFTALFQTLYDSALKAMDRDATLDWLAFIATREVSASSSLL